MQSLSQKFLTQSSAVCKPNRATHIVLEYSPGPALQGSMQRRKARCKELTTEPQQAVLLAYLRLANCPMCGLLLYRLVNCRKLLSPQCDGHGCPKGNKAILCCCPWPHLSQATRKFSIGSIFQGRHRAGVRLGTSAQEGSLLGVRIYLISCIW